MSYRTILVHVETGAKAERRLALAAGLAERFGARLVGLTVVLPPTWGGVAGLPQLIADIEQSNEAYVDACRTLFQQATASRPEDCEFHYHVGTVRDVLAEESAFSDLIVVSDAAGESAEESILTADDALFASSAPVLVVPHGLEHAFEPRTVFIAWKPTREAARAVRDALPMLHAAAKIVVGVVAPDDASKEAARLDDIGAYLGRHGLRVETTEVPGDGSVGRTIIALAQAAGADLIVAGGYGHAPLREWLMGGVTEALLHDSPIPCLISH
jgi:nucleotide-binding universal stress UspA family protein